MLVHLVGTIEQLLEVVKADRQADGETDRGPKRVSATNPVPELEHVGFGNTKLRHTLGVGGKGNEVFGNVGFLRMGKVYVSAGDFWWCVGMIV